MEPHAEIMEALADLRSGMLIVLAIVSCIAGCIIGVAFATWRNRHD